MAERALNKKISYNLKGLLLGDFIASTLFAISLTFYGAILLFVASGVLTITEIISLSQWIRAEATTSAFAVINTVTGFAFIALAIGHILERKIEVISISILLFLIMPHNFDWVIFGVLAKQIVLQILPAFYFFALIATMGFYLTKHLYFIKNPNKMIELYEKEYKNGDLFHFRLGKALYMPIDPRRFGKNRAKFFNI